MPVRGLAQEGGSAALFDVNSQNFPQVEAYLKVFDSQGGFVHGLNNQAVQALENDQPVALDQLQEVRPGVQFVVALNPGHTFAMRNSRGESRYDFVMSALEDWGKSRSGSNLDDWSLTSPAGAAISHTSAPQAWLESLNAVSRDAREITPSLDSMLLALDLAMDVPPRTGMGRAILWVTAPLEGGSAAGIENIQARALQQRVSIFVWLVTPVGAPISPSMQRVMDLATATGGSSFIYSDEEVIPDPESYLEPLRSIYRLQYTSQLQTSGAHNLVVTVTADEGSWTTQPLPFEMEIQPPEPIFISPPLEVERKIEDSLSEAVSAEITSADFTPTEIPLSLILDFPDGHIRPIVQTRLYIDGVLAAENSQAPFDRFTWDLTPYTISGPHTLRVEAEDTLGLVGSSIETYVTVSVNQPEANIWAAVSRHLPVIAGLLVVVSGAILLLVLVLGGRIHPLRNRPGGKANGKKRKAQPKEEESEKDEGMARRLPGWVNRLHWPQRHVAPQAYAFLVPISNNTSLPGDAPLPVNAEEVTLGCDPRQSTIILNDPSVDELHARLRLLEDGSFLIQDEGSIAGTWLNYLPVSRQGMRLEHGDQVNLGRAGFRFTLRQPTQIRRPMVKIIQTREETHA